MEEAETEPLLRPDFWVTPHPYMKARQHRHSLFGPERRGAPVLGFTRVSDLQITDHSQVYDCDCVIVLDETLCDAVDTTAGLKDEGIYVINTSRDREDFMKDPRFDKIKNLVTIDATDIALRILGAPIVNTVLLVQR